MPPRATTRAGNRPARPRRVRQHARLRPWLAAHVDSSRSRHGGGRDDRQQPLPDDRFEGDSEPDQEGGRHDGGRPKIDDDRVMVKSKKSGKTTITVGSAQGKVSPLDEHPVSDTTIEVVGVEIVQTV